MLLNSRSGGFRWWLAVAGGWSLFLSMSLPTAVGQIEPIGPVTIVANQPVDYFFVNDIPPNPDRKLFDFLGEAFNPTSMLAIVEVLYDYVDANGNTVYLQPGGNQIAIPPGGPWPVDPGPVVLNFCPRDVSLHFNLLEGEVLDLQGQYGHICFPVPEPSGALPLLAGLLSLAWRWRRSVV